MKLLNIKSKILVISFSLAGFFLLVIPLFKNDFAFAGGQASLKGNVYMDYEGTKFSLTGVYILKEAKCYPGAWCNGVDDNVLFQSDASGEYRMEFPNPTLPPGGNCDPLGMCGLSCAMNPTRFRAYFPDGYSNFPGNANLAAGHWEPIIGGQASGPSDSTIGRDPYWVETDQSGYTWLYVNISNDGVYTGFDFRWVPNNNVYLYGKVTDSNGTPLSGVPINGTDSADLSLTAKGFQGEYFNNQDLSGASVLVRNDAQVDFDWGTGSPDPSVPSDGFSVRWTRTHYFSQDGDYTFSTTTDDGVRLYVDGNLIIDHWVNQGVSTYTATVPNVTVGNHIIKMEYYDWLASAVAKLSWAPTSNPNRALNQPATAGSTWYLDPACMSGTQTCFEAYGPQNAVDGINTSGWMGDQGKNFDWVSVDLGGQYEINKVGVYTYHNVPYRILISNDQINWIVVYSTPSGGGRGGIAYTNLSGSGQSARYVRWQGIQLPNANASYRLYVFEVYGIPVPSSECHVGSTTTGADGTFTFNNISAGQRLCLKVPSSVTVEGVTYINPSPPSYICQIAGGKFDPDGCNISSGQDEPFDTYYNFIYQPPGVSVSFSGKIWLDNDKDRIKDSTENCYNGGLSLSAGGITTTPSYQSDSSCSASSSYSLNVSVNSESSVTLTLNVPAGYTSVGWNEGDIATSSITGSGNSYPLAVGTTDINKTINFAIVKDSAWFQVQKGDFLTTGSFSPAEGFMSPPDGGVVIAKGSITNPLANPPQWSVENYLNSQELLNFDYYQKIASKTATIPLTVSLSSTLDQGFYTKEGGLTIDSDLSITGNKKITILVNGTLNINRNITVEVGSALTFIVKNDIIINGSVGNVEGIYIADGTIDTSTSNSGFTGSGIFVAWGSAGISHHRNLDNNTTAAEQFKYRADFLTALPDYLTKSTYSWQETLK